MIKTVSVGNSIKDEQLINVDTFLFKHVKRGSILEYFACPGVKCIGQRAVLECVRQPFKCIPDGPCASQDPHFDVKLHCGARLCWNQKVDAKLLAILLSQNEDIVDQNIRQHVHHVEQNFLFDVFKRGHPDRDTCILIRYCCRRRR